MKKLIVIAVLVLGFSSAFAGTNTTNAGKVDASSMIDMTPIKKRHTADANMVNGNTNTIAKPATIANVTTNDMTTVGFSNNPAALGTNGSVKNNNGVGANISKAADQMLDKSTDAASNAIIVNYN